MSVVSVREGTIYPSGHFQSVKPEANKSQVYPRPRYLCIKPTRANELQNSPSRQLHPYRSRKPISVISLRALGVPP